jgi:hypothetical protein
VGESVLEKFPVGHPEHVMSAGSTSTKATTARQGRLVLSLPTYWFIIASTITSRSSSGSTAREKSVAGRSDGPLICGDAFRSGRQPNKINVAG